MPEEGAPVSSAQGPTEAKHCATCGAEVCDVRLPGEDFVICDWPPLLPVVEFRHAIVANDFQEYVQLVDGEVKPSQYTYTGFRAPGHIASMLVMEHRCDALTMHLTVLTKEGQRRMEEGS